MNWLFQFVHLKGIIDDAAVWASAGYYSIFMSSCNYVNFQFHTRLLFVFKTSLLALCCSNIWIFFQRKCLQDFELSKTVHLILKIFI